MSDQTPLPPPRARRHRIPPHPPSFPSLRFPIPCIQKRPRISLIVSATQHRTHLRPPSLAKAFPTHSSSRQQPHPTNTTSYFTLLTYKHSSTIPNKIQVRFGLRGFSSLGTVCESWRPASQYHYDQPPSIIAVFFLRVRWYLPQEVEEVGFGLAGAFNDFGV